MQGVASCVVTTVCVTMLFSTAAGQCYCNPPVHVSWDVIQFQDECGNYCQEHGCESGLYTGPSIGWHGRYEEAHSLDLSQCPTANSANAPTCECQTINTGGSCGYSVSRSTVILDPRTVPSGNHRQILDDNDCNFPNGEVPQHVKDDVGTTFHDQINPCLEEFTSTCECRHVFESGVDAEGGWEISGSYTGEHCEIPPEKKITWKQSDSSMSFGIFILLVCCCCAGGGGAAFFFVKK
eukprot:SAG31_NODE_5790_length_2327_cov_1.929982_6_plen_237_part_00